MGTSQNYIGLEPSIRRRQGELGAWRLPPVAQLPPVRGLRPVDAPMEFPDSVSIERDQRMPSPLLGRRRNLLSSLTEVGIASVLAALVAGYFVFASSHQQTNVTTAPQSTTNASAGLTG